MQLDSLSSPMDVRYPHQVLETRETELEDEIVEVGEDTTLLHVSSTSPMEISYPDVALTESENLDLGGELKAEEGVAEVQTPPLEEIPVAEESVAEVQTPPLEETPIAEEDVAEIQTPPLEETPITEEGVAEVQTPSLEETSTIEEDVTEIQT